MKPLPDDLNQKIRGYQESRIILTALELDVFSAIGEGASPAEVAGRSGTDARATELLLNALVAMGLLTKKDERFSPTSVSHSFLSGGGEDDARAAILHNSSLWKRWSHLTECVRKGTAADIPEVEDRGDDWTRPFIAAMHRNAAERAKLVVLAVGTSGVRHLLDVGGGSGAYSIAFAEASDELHADVFDLPSVLPITREHIREAGLEARIQTRAGDLRRDDFGNGYDLVFVSAICHMLDPVENEDLLKRSHAALAPGGRIVIQDFILEPDRTAPKNAAIFSLNMLTGTKGGRSYAEDEYAAWLSRTGFQEVERIGIPGPTNLMVGTRKPA